MNLPNPDPIEFLHSEKLVALIQQTIMKSGGVISFARFMELALYAPGLGYYSSGKYKFGARGDFVTAPEISPFFAQCVARQCQQILSELPTGDILEFGAGSGIFAKDLLLSLEKLDALPKNYFILEVSAELRERQQNLLQSHCPHLYKRINWLDKLPAHGLTGIIFANEVMDAMPVHCFQIVENSVKERCVAWDGKHFVFQLTEPNTAELKQKVKQLLTDSALPNGYQSEINLMLPAWVNSITHLLNKGVILLFDYGYGRSEYYHPDRSMGTLMCYYQHRRHADPFKLVGLQDITAHVDFTSVIESAVMGEGELAGYTTQMGFLLACGLLELAEDENVSSSLERFQQAQAIKKLTLPSQMGELVKVIGLSKNFTKPLLGFTLHDRRRDL